MLRSRAASLIPWAVALVLIGLTGPRAGLAQSTATNAFTVEGIVVDRTAANAAAARAQALDEGRVLAFRKLMARLVPEDAGPPPNLDGAAIDALIRDFDIASEKTSGVRYIATLAYRFHAEPVRDLLRNAGLSFAETVSRPRLVLPVYRAGEASRLWDDPNPWRDAWMTAPRDDGLVPLVVPRGELDDIAAIDAAQAVGGDRQRLDALAARYNAGGAVVVQARMSGPGEASAVQITINRFDGGTGEQTSILQYSAREGEDETALLARAVQGVADRIQDPWKRANMVNLGMMARITATVDIASFAEWLAIRDGLAAIPIVQRTDLRYLARERAVVDLHFAGDEQRLALALEQQQLNLYRDGPDWRLSLFSGSAVPVPVPAAVQEPAAPPESTTGPAPEPAPAPTLSE
ncbi:MAG: DUF2066 domain-containing protein [Proteobacteria bacterium]|nr:DUF2066 domain-containing protein [Pseudomonadota bacterium]